MIQCAPAERRDGCEFDLAALLQCVPDCSRDGHSAYNGSMTNRNTLGGIIHTYQKYDPVNLPAPTQPPPDLVSPALEHMLMFGDARRLTDEELARAIHLDPSQIAGLGPSLDALLAMLLERKRKILAKYETESVQGTARKEFQKAAG